MENVSKRQCAERDFSEVEIIFVSSFDHFRWIRFWTIIWGEINMTEMKFDSSTSPKGMESSVMTRPRPWPTVLTVFQTRKRAVWPSSPRHSIVAVFTPTPKETVSMKISFKSSIFLRSYSSKQLHFIICFDCLNFILSRWKIANGARHSPSLRHRWINMCDWHLFLVPSTVHINKTIPKSNPNAVFQFRSQQFSEHAY